MERIAKYMELSGDSREIGYQLGSAIKDIPEMKRLHSASGRLPGAKVKIAKAVLNQWCPGVTEEVKGFAEALQTAEENLFYYLMTYLVPRCSQISLDGGLAENGHVLAARSYEFSADMEEFTVLRTSVKGKHTHLGTSVLLMGREEGINDQGLVVTMSSCGFPVGAQDGMRSPALEGLQFWAVIRALLENCATAKEAEAYMKDMPVAFNLNMIVTDKGNNRVLFETYDGRQAVRWGAAGESLWAANHAVIPEMAALEAKVMAHSKMRFESITEWIAEQGAGGASSQKLKELLLRPYPQGLNCSCYKEFFGTTKSMVFDSTDGTMELCWGGRAENGWETLSVHEPLKGHSKTIHLDEKAPDMAMFHWVER